LRPQQVGNVLLPEPARDVNVHNGFAFVVLPKLGLRMFDVHDPHAPTWRTDYVQVGGYQLQIAGNIAYFTVANLGLQLLDISDPVHPRRLNTYVRSDVVGSWVTGFFAYLVGGTDLRVVDVSNPARLVERGSYTWQYPWYPSAIHVIGSTAYVNL